ncbi:hypothetical protein I4F81_008262 [Pyropia yezoensis]|uniref:Uncharacterized protein n=1 Tax=Pyropia yezoensis TaxID=2788 RepID=A0ACC3C7G5_PYRYE|nr:hypothetical protein I4F81_008262 [Neopyropia yezoensis]
MAAARAGARPGGRVPSYTVFRVAPAEAVTLLPLSTSEALDDLTAARVVFVGEHHLSLVDHQTTANGVVDEYIAGRLSEEGLYEAVEWDARWGWPFEAYLPLLRMAKRRHMPIVALGVNAELIHGVLVSAQLQRAAAAAAAAASSTAAETAVAAVPPAGGPTAVAAAAAAVAPPPPLASPRQAVAAAAAAAAASFPVRTVLVNPAPGDANDGGGALRLALAPPPGGAPPQPIADMLQGGAWWHWLRRSLPPLEDLRV